MSKPSPTLEIWLQKARKATAYSNPKAPEQIAGKVLKLNPTQIAAQSDRIRLTSKQKLKLDNLLGRLLGGRPLSSVLYSTHFYGITIKVNPRVLSPRAETEILVQYAIENIPNKSKVFDIGTGTGAIGLSLAKARPDLQITLTDLTNKTLNIAKSNARKNKINTVEYVKSNLIKKVDQKDLQGAYFLANLPYVNPRWKGLRHKNLKHEPNKALFASNNGLQIIQNLLDQLTSKNLLTNSNWSLIEHDPKQYKDLETFCKKLSLTTKQVSNFITLVKLN